MDLLQQEMVFLQYRRDEQIRAENDKTGIEFLRANVPEVSQLDRLLRYETTLERNFDRILNQIERLQRLRKGQPVSPTLDVRVST